MPHSKAPSDSPGDALAGVAALAGQLKPARSAALAASAAGLTALLLIAPGLRAQPAQPPQGMADYQALAQQWASKAAASYLPADAAELRLEVLVGALDNRLRLAPCASVEPYLPPGSRLWGHSRVGLRCNEGSAHWNVTLPVTVKAFGPAWVVRSQVAQGSPITAADVMQGQADWAEDSSPVLQTAAQWSGQIATHLLTTGQVLRASQVRPMQVFQAGSDVRVVASGAGFEVSADAQALTAGIVGQPARVRMDNGRVTTGTVLDAHTVRVDL